MTTDPLGMEVRTSGTINLAELGLSQNAPKVGDAGFFRLLDEMRAMHIKKSLDYGTDEDPLANIRGSAVIGIEPWRAAYLRLLDKINRINRYCVKGRLENETVRDSFLDAANYALLALRLFDEWKIYETGSDNEPAPVASEPVSATAAHREFLAESRKLEALLDTKRAI